MRTVLFKISGVFFALFLLTSCLGSGDAYYENGRGFVYLKYTDIGHGDKLYAFDGYDPILAPSSWNNLERNRGYYAKYKVTISGSNYLTPEYLDVLDEGLPVPKAEFRWDKPYTGFQNPKDSIHPQSLTLKAGLLTNYIDDNWLIEYKMALKSDDKVEVCYYYDPNGQSESGVPLEKNQIIIDIRFVKIPSTEPGDAKIETYNALGSLSRIRSEYTPEYPSGEDYVFVPIKFRYLVDQGGDYPPKMTTIGSFNIESAGAFGLQFNRK